MNETDVAVRLEGHDHEIGSIKHRLNDIENIVDAVHSLAVEMSEQTAEMKHMNETIKQLNEDVTELKAKPANRWENLIGTFMGAIAGAAAAFFFK